MLIVCLVKDLANPCSNRIGWNWKSLQKGISNSIFYFNFCIYFICDVKFNHLIIYKEYANILPDFFTPFSSIPPINANGQKYPLKYLKIIIILHLQLFLKGLQWGSQPNLVVPDLSRIAHNIDRHPRERKIAILLIIIWCFIIARVDLESWFRGPPRVRAIFKISLFRGYLLWALSLCHIWRIGIGDSFDTSSRSLPFWLVPYVYLQRIF